MPAKNLKPLRCIVGPETVRMLQLGHPWVIADRYTAGWPKGGCGELVELCDPAGKPLATALLDRLLYKCEIIKLEGNSYRMKNRKTIFVKQD